MTVQSVCSLRRAALTAHTIEVNGAAQFVPEQSGLSYPANFASIGVVDYEDLIDENSAALWRGSSLRRSYGLCGGVWD